MPSLDILKFTARMGYILPGGGKFILALSSTSTQSLPLPFVGGEKVRMSRPWKVPISVDSPVRGLYHQAFALTHPVRRRLISAPKPVGIYTKI